MTNEQIATEVMGWEWCVILKAYTRPNDGFIFRMKSLFLSDHNAAMMVVEKMREDGFEYKFCSISVDKHLVDFWTFGINNKVGRSENKSLCYAISEAALAAKGN